MSRRSERAGRSSLCSAIKQTYRAKISRAYGLLGKAAHYLHVAVCMTLRFQQYRDKDNAEHLRRIERLLGVIISNQETLQMSFDDLKAAQDATDAKIDAVKADIDALMAKLAAIPPAGMTPEQEAALAAAVDHAKAINDKLSAVDALNP